MAKTRGKIKLIYILGTAYSGSTILGFVLGSAKEIFNAGEISYLSELNFNIEKCSCESKVKDCKFWYFLNDKFKIYRNSGFLKKTKLILSILLRLRTSNKPLAEFNDNDLLDEIRINSKARYVLDNSKSLWRLMHLMKYPDIDIKVIYIKRNIQGNVSSYIKHGHSFWKGLFYYKILNYLMYKFINQNKIDVIKINYENLCNNPDTNLKKLGNFLDVRFSDYARRVRETEYHVPTGNLGTRAQKMKDFKGLKLDDSWEKRLTNFQKIILRIFE